jgi:hypothetical protein
VALRASSCRTVRVLMDFRSRGGPNGANDKLSPILGRDRAFQTKGRDPLSPAATVPLNRGGQCGVASARQLH